MKDFFKSIPHQFRPEEEALLRKALEFATEAHTGQKRKNGEDYIIHPRAAAIILGQIFPCPIALAAALLHDVHEDTGVSLEDIQKRFGEEIARLVDGVTKLGHVRFRNSTDKYYVENLRKLFFATSEDIRVILIKLADRIHNMRTISHIPEDKQIKVASETLEVYAPIATRLGIGSWKDELENLCFQIVNPKEYQETKTLVETELKTREENIKEMQKYLVHTLKTEGTKFMEVSGRVKRLYSLFHKLKKYDQDIAKIHDIIALRIITKSTADCYAALGAIHKHFQPVPGRIKDYIATPKPNGYQSIHTTVIGKGGKTFEIQIRTDLMHEEAERGVAAHWFYSEEGKNDTVARLQAPWLRELHAWQEGTNNPEEFLENLKIDFFKNRIFVYTPKGDIKDLPAGATVIDFAFSVHTDLALHMMGARINSKMASIYDELEKEDEVEIIKSKNPVKISPKWLEFTRTNNAKSKIRAHLNQQNRGLIQRVKDMSFPLPKFFRKK